MGKFFKQASRLRKALKIIRANTGPPFSTITDYDMYLKRSGEFVGNISISRSKLGGTPRIVFSEVTEKFQGMGLGKKLYGEVLMREGTLVPGFVTSKSAQRVWKSLYRRFPRYEKGVSGA